MKRLSLLLALTLVLVFGVAATAYAANPPGTYKLTVTVYYDADADACWDANEPIIPGSWVLLGEPFPGDVLITNSCGSASTYRPIGQTVVGWYVGTHPWPYDLFPTGYAWSTEATPMKSEAEYYLAKVVMNRNRCMLFGIAPTEYNPPGCTASCPPCTVR